MDYAEILLKIQTIIADIIDEDDPQSIDITEDLSAIGFDDGAKYGLITPVNDEFNINLELDDFDDVETIEDIADLVDEKLNPKLL